ncbi:hypothetical protein [Bacillus wiedmannii]|uniref:hypothetical protein n=1 Tax=Bacillus wiedmannii TaxID=1890302 RepID=UPI000BEF77C3|nr:hypothetical protein [Bacillus wiedmannii]PEM24434.1 hypothetical protein CN617_24720 [Bacillus wiedmannii]
MDILIVPQEFGYGPAAEIINVMELVQKNQNQALEYKYWLNHATLNLCESQVFNNIEGESIFDFSKRDKTLAEIKMIVSSYDAESVFWGWWHNKKVIYYNGISSFLEMNFQKKDKIKYYIDYFNELKEQKKIDLFTKELRNLFENELHTVLVLAMHFADFCFVRNNPNLVINENYPENVKVISALVPYVTKQPKDFYKNNEYIYISLSGSLAPVIPFEKNIAFVQNALKFFEELSSRKEFTNIDFIFTCNSKIYSLIKNNNYSNKIKVYPSKDPMENAWLMQNAQLVFASPGYTTVHECAHLNTPVIFLPEQNGSQPIGYHVLQKSGYPSLPSLITSLNSDLANEFREDCINELYDRAIKLFKGIAYQQQVKSCIDFSLNLLADEKMNQHVSNSQRKAVEKSFHGFSGTSELAEIISKNIDSFNVNINNH